MLKLFLVPNSASVLGSNLGPLGSEIFTFQYKKTAKCFSAIYLLSRYILARSKVKVKDVKMQEPFSAVTSPHIVRFTSVRTTVFKFRGGMLAVPRTALFFCFIFKAIITVDDHSYAKESLYGCCRSAGRYDQRDDGYNLAHSKTLVRRRSYVQDRSLLAGTTSGRLSLQLLLGTIRYFSLQHVNLVFHSST